jgi:branched-chain amino acid transport system permease protein
LDKTSIMEFFTISLLNGISYGLLLFMLSSGLTLIYSMMGVLNFAHASFYMLGAFFAYSTTLVVGYWPALIVAPLLVGVMGAVFERYFLRKVHAFGHVPELLITFGLAFIILELVQLVWGRASVDYRVPAALDGPLFSVYGTQFPTYRGFMMVVALLMLVSVWLVLKKTRIGLVIQAALTHPETVETLGHNVPRVFMMVFGGGAALAGLAGVIGGNAFVTEPNMAGALGPIIFVVVVVGGLGSLGGALLASLLIGVVQTFAIGINASMVDGLALLGFKATASTFGYELLVLKVSEIAPIMPYLFMVLILIFRPKGLMGTREG